MMKKSIVFAVSFIVFYFFIQWGSGFLLTRFYTPDVNDAWQQSSVLSPNVSFGEQSGLFPWISVVVALALALFISMFWRKSKTEG